MRTVDPVRRAAKRQQIIDAAAELFAARGLDATSTADICRAAGMSPGNVFHYFASKRDIFVAVITDGEGEKAKRLTGARGAAQPLAALLDVVRILIGPATNPLGPPLVMEAMMQARRDPELAGWLEQDRSAELAVLEHLVNRATRTRQISPGQPARQVAAWLHVLVGAFYLQAATDPRFRPAEQTATLELVITRFLQAR